MRHMKCVIKGRDLEVTDAIRERIEKKLGKLDKFFYTGTRAHVTIGLQKNRQTVEATIRHRDVIYRAEESSANLYDAIDKVADVIERQIRKHRTRLGKRIKDAAALKETARAKPATEEKAAAEAAFDVIRTKRFPVVPMSVDEAILQMDLLNHEFFLFLNAESKEINVVYKRKAGGYGLLIPEYE
jgi:putative sigma-54 modulation protein